MTLVNNYWRDWPVELKPTSGDVLVVVMAVLLLVALYGHFWAGLGGEGVRVRLVSASGQAQMLSLARDQTLHIAGPLGDSVLEIRHGRIRFLESPCQGKQCIHAGWLRLAGSFSACLPNRISITVLGRQQRFDSINY